MTPSRFIGELAQDDLRHANLPQTADEAAHEKTQGTSRLKALRALVTR
jgi:hypothetical protein